MCLILFAWHVHPDYPLVVVANRDEFYTRPTRPAAWWGQSVSILGGRDDECGGTWLGINRRGRMAFLTNFRSGEPSKIHSPSRGLLTLGALQHSGSLSSWATEHPRLASDFKGYNLVVTDPLAHPESGRDAQMLYASNRDPLNHAAPNRVRQLEPGIYGLSNAQLDTPWPKVARAVAGFACQIADSINPAKFMALMNDRQVALDSDLPQTGIPLDWERALSAIHVRTQGYGTRSTTYCAVRRDGLVQFKERCFDADPTRPIQEREFEFVVDGAGYARQPLMDQQDQNG